MTVTGARLPRQQFSSRQFSGRQFSSRPIRLTRRGRLVIVLGLLAAIIVVLASAGRPSEATGHGPRTQPVTVTVQTGETLWQLASRVAPGVDPRLVVAEIERLNTLAGPTVYAGQQLRVPHYS